jgi:hypothetical protein
MVIECQSEGQAGCGGAESGEHEEVFRRDFLGVLCVSYGHELIRVASCAASAE